MKETPLPFTVCARIKTGFLGVGFMPSCELLKSAENLAHLVSIDLDHMPAEGSPFVGERFDRHDLATGPSIWPSL